MGITQVKKLYISAALITAALLAGGFFMPLGFYIPTKTVCPDGEPPVARLHLIKGDTIQKQKDADVEPGPSAECARQVKYVLYIL